MRNLIFGNLGLMILATLFLTSCQKDSLNELQQPDPSDVEYIRPVGPDDGHEPLRIFFDNGLPDGEEGIDYGCLTGKGSCLPTVVVTNNAPVYKVLTGLSSTNNVYGVSNILQDSYDTLNDYLNGSLIDGVIQGEYELDLRGDLLNDNNLYLIFKKNNEIINVQPFHTN